MKRLPSFSFMSWLLAVSLLFIITCKKEYSYEGGRTAEYTLLGSPQQCTDAVVSGNYNSGILLDSSNTVQVTANITAAGSYTLATGEVNGISFSASGSFTDTGTYTIILYGRGTPAANGDFSYLIPGTAGCYFPLSVTDQTEAAYTLSGTPNDCTNPVVNGVYMKGVRMNPNNTVFINVDVSSAGPFSATTDTVNGIFFSAEGTFTATGALTVTLLASGTPDLPELSHFTLKAGTSQCSFYIPVGNAEPVATYVLQSAYNNGGFYCAPGSVQGAYTAGTPLNSSNTLTVNAYVTVPGNYTISTTEINGIMFTYTGTFATTGPQDVVLKGSGTPAGIGTFTFTPQIVGPAPLGGETCGLDVEVK